MTCGPATGAPMLALILCLAQPAAAQEFNHLGGTPSHFNHLGSPPSQLNARPSGPTAADRAARAARPDYSVVRQGKPGIEALAGTHIWIKTSQDPPAVDYCALLRESGLIVECDYGWKVTDWESNVMLKCGLLPDDTTAWLMQRLGLSELAQWDWRQDPDYGMPYCDQMDAITMEIPAP